MAIARCRNTVVRCAASLLLLGGCASVRPFPGIYPWETYGKLEAPHDRFDQRANASFQGYVKQGIVIAEFPDAKLNLFGNNTETRLTASGVSHFGISDVPFPWANRITIGPELKMEHRYRSGRFLYGVESDYDCRSGNAARYGGKEGCAWNTRFAVEFWFGGDLIKNPKQ